MLLQPSRDILGFYKYLSLKVIIKQKQNWGIHCKGENRLTSNIHIHLQHFTTKIVYNTRE